MLGVIVAVAVVVATYGWLEAGWLRTRVLVLHVPCLPERLDGLRIGHLSDFHLERLSRVAAARAHAPRAG